MSTPASSRPARAHAAQREPFTEEQRFQEGDRRGERWRKSECPPPPRHTGWTERKWSSGPPAPRRCPQPSRASRRQRGRTGVCCTRQSTASSSEEQTTRPPATCTAGRSTNRPSMADSPNSATARWSRPMLPASLFMACASFPRNFPLIIRPPAARGNPPCQGSPRRVY